MQLDQSSRMCHAVKQHFHAVRLPLRFTGYDAQLLNREMPYDSCYSGRILMEANC